MWAPFLTLTIIESQETRTDTLHQISGSLTNYFSQSALTTLIILAVIGAILVVAFFYGYSKAILVTTFSLLGLGLVFTVNMLLKPQQKVSQASSVIKSSGLVVKEEDNSLIVEWNTDIPSTGAIILENTASGEGRTHFSAQAGNKSLRHEVIVTPVPEKGIYKLRLLVNGRPDESSLKTIQVD